MSSVEGASSSHHTTHPDMEVDMRLEPQAIESTQMGKQVEEEHTRHGAGVPASRQNKVDCATVGLSNRC